MSKIYNMLTLGDSTLYYREAKFLDKVEDEGDDKHINMVNPYSSISYTPLALLSHNISSINKTVICQIPLYVKNLFLEAVNHTSAKLFKDSFMYSVFPFIMRFHKSITVSNWEQLNSKIIPFGVEVNAMIPIIYKTKKTKEKFYIGQGCIFDEKFNLLFITCNSIFLIKLASRVRVLSSKDIILHINSYLLDKQHLFNPLIEEIRRLGLISSMVIHTTPLNYIRSCPYPANNYSFTKDSSLPDPYSFKGAPSI